MILQLEILALFLLIGFIMWKQKMVPSFNITVWPWIQKNVEFLVNCLPATASVLMFLKAFTWMDAKSFEGHVAQTLGLFVLAAVAFGVTLGIITFTRGLMDKWRGW